MNTYICILRGINVSGQKKMKMADLRDLLASSDEIHHVQTYIQSGNILFDANHEDTSFLCRHIHELILDRYGFEVPVVMRTLEEWEQVVKNIPYPPDIIQEEKSIYITFLEKTPTIEQVKQLDPTPFHPEQFIILNREIYLYVPRGYGRTKLNNNFFEKKLGITATTRNWKTTNKLLELGQQRTKSD
jgi:uncharacterized protein (DUF1697 family)